MVFDEKKYTEDSIIKQLTLIQLHSTDGSALDAGCSCIEGKHLHALEGLAEEGTMTTKNAKEKAFYEWWAETARHGRKSIEDGSFEIPHNPGPGPHNPSNPAKIKFEALDKSDEEAVQLAENLTKTTELWEHNFELGDGRIVRLMNVSLDGREEIWQVFEEEGKGKLIITESHNPGPGLRLGRAYHPHYLTECEKTHPKVLKKLVRCIRKVKKREGCSPPYTDCPVNPVAVCRASVKCP